MAAEAGRAAIWEVDIATGGHRIFASGLRNPNGMAWQPQSDALWTVVNERDEIGSDLVPDYLTSVKDGAFYGWPYSYYGQHVDERVKPQQPELVAKAVAPDYALGPHTASLGLAWSNKDSTALPAAFQSGMFIGQHGSWNRKPASGYKVIFVPFQGAQPNGQPTDVLTGFLNDDGKAFGRPVGVALDGRGALAGGRRCGQQGVAGDGGRSGCQVALQAADRGSGRRCGWCGAGCFRALLVRFHIDPPDVRKCRAHVVLDRVHHTRGLLGRRAVAKRDVDRQQHVVRPHVHRERQRCAVHLGRAQRDLPQPLGRLAAARLRRPAGRALPTPTAPRHRPAATRSGSMPHRRAPAVAVRGLPRHRLRRSPAPAARPSLRRSRCRSTDPCLHATRARTGAGLWSN